MHSKKAHIAIYLSLALLTTAVATAFPKYFNQIRIGTYALAFIGGYSALMLFRQLLVWKHLGAQRIRINKPDAIILVSLLYFLIRYISSPPFNRCPENGVVFLLGYLSYFAIRNLSGANSKTGYWVLYSLVFFGLVQALYAVGQWLSLLPSLLGFKLGGTYGNPGDLANVLLPCYAIALSLLLQEQKRKVRWLLGFTALLFLWVLVLSMARTAWIASFIIALIVFRKQLISVKDYIFKKAVRYIPVLILTAVVFSLSFYKAYTLKQDSADGRLFIWKVCAQAIQEKPLLGYGFDSFKSTYSQAQAQYFSETPNDTRNAYLADDILFAYNDYIQIAMEYGIVGLIVFIVLVILVLRKWNTNPIVSVSSIAMVAILLSMTTSYPLRNGSIVVVLMVLIGTIASQDNTAILEFHLPVSIRKSIVIISLGMAVLSSVYAYQLFRSGVIWENTVNEHFDDVAYCQASYQKLHKTLKYDKGFLYHYGRMRFKWNQPAECIRHYEKYYLNCLDSKMLVTLGTCYEQLNNFEKAEHSYQQAIFTKPQLFVPRYMLFKLYAENNMDTKALQIARELNELTIKVYSQTVREIKTEINEYLFKKTLEDQCITN